MEKEFQEIIKKNLPQHVGEELQKELADLFTLRKTLVEKDKLIELQKKEIVEQLSKLIEYAKFDGRNNCLDAAEVAVRKRENDIQIEELKYQLASEKEKTEFTKQVALGLVRNTEFKSKMFDNRTTPYTDNNGYTQYGNVTVTAEETKSAE